MEGKGIDSSLVFLFVFILVGLGRSLRRDAKGIPRPELLLCQRAEEIDFIFARGLPLVVPLEGTLKVRLDVDVESLRL